MIVINNIKGIAIVGDIFTGKSSVSKELVKKIDNSQYLDKSKILTYPPLKMGYDKFGALDDVSLEEFIDVIKNFDGKIDKKYIDSLSRSKTVEFSNTLKNRFYNENKFYNHHILTPFIDENKFQVIAGIRYFETYQKLSKEGFKFFGLILRDKDELVNRSEQMHNHTWEDPFYQLGLEDKFFDVQKIMSTLPAENKFDTVKYKPDEIADKIYQIVSDTK